MPLGMGDDNESNLKYLSINIMSEASDKLRGVEKFSEANNNNIENNNNNNNNNNNDGERFLVDSEKENANNYSSNNRGVLAQCMVAGAVLLMTTGVGMPIGYSAILLPQLNSANSSLKVDQDLGSWIASIHSLASPLGSLVSGPLLDAIGRRSVLQIATIPLCIGWILIGCSKNIWFMLLGRVFAGFSVGMTAVAAQVLVGECSDPGIRGFLMILSMVAYSGGILLVYILGAVLDWRTVAFSGVILPIIALTALSFATESPAWLVKRDKIKNARSALLWLRGGDEKQVVLEMSVLKSSINTSLSKPSINMSLCERICHIKSEILQPGVIKPLVIINSFFLLQVLSGTYLIVFYGVDLVRDIGGKSIDNYLAGVMTATVRFIFCGVSCVMLLKIGRRPIALISASGTAVSSLILAGYFFLKNGDSVSDKYVMAICVFLYVSLNTIGLMTLPGLLIGELLPQRARGIGGGFTMFVFNLGLFGATKVFPMVKDIVGIAGIFAIFGVSAVLETLFTWLVLPETKNRTLQDIENYFKNGNVLWITARRKNRM